MDGPPSDNVFDAVVIGTGLPNAILAAALSRIGRRVLHIDSREFYGEEWTTFTLKEIRELDTIYTHPATDLAGSDTPQHESAHAGKAAQVKTVPARYSTTAFHSEETVVVPQQPPTLPTQSISSTAVKKPTTTDADVSDAQDSSTVAVDDSSAASGSDAESSADPTTSAAPHEGTASATAASASATSTIASSESANAAHTTAPAASMSLADRQAAALEELLKQTRRYNIDMCPRACLSRGALIQLLITSNIGRYLEFKAVAETYIRMGQENREVPCSKQTLLLNKSVPAREKRLLMKFLQFCTAADSTTDEGPGESTPAPATVPETGFLEYLRDEWRFSEDLAKYIVFAIANVDAMCPAREALAHARRFFSSLGHYGKTPYIYPLYGVGEVPQAFCRLCAVFGGTYMLRQRIEGFIVTTDGHESSPQSSQHAEPDASKSSQVKSRCGGVTINGEVFEAKWVVTTSACLPETYPSPSAGSRVVRAIVITDGPLSCIDFAEHDMKSIASYPQTKYLRTVVPEAGDHPIVTLCVPPGTADNEATVNAFVYSSDSSVCPAGKWVTQFVTTGSPEKSSREHLEPLVRSLTRTPVADASGATADVTETAVRSGSGNPSAAKGNASTSAAAGDVAADGRKPRLIYAMYFSMDNEQPIVDNENDIGGLVVCRRPPLEATTFEGAVAEARRMFDIICPGEEFLPKAPEPEEIDWGSPQQPSPEEVEARIATLEKDTDIATRASVTLAHHVARVVSRTEALRTAVVSQPQEQRHANTLAVAMRTAELCAIRADLGGFTRRVKAIKSRVNALVQQPSATTTSP